MKGRLDVLGKIVDAVLAYRPKPKTAKARKASVHRRKAKPKKRPLSKHNHG